MLAFSLVLSSTVWAADVPLKWCVIGEHAGDCIEGVGKLENGHLTATLHNIAGVISMSGDILEDELNVDATGPLWGWGGYGSANAHCVGHGSTSPATGKVSVSVDFTCNTSGHGSLTLDLPVIAATSTGTDAPQPAPAATSLPPPAAPPALANLDFGRYEALVIGDDRYQGGLPALKTAAADARAVADILTSAYGFKVTLLQNATRDQIIGTLAKFRRTLTWDDNLLIYFAGHGSYDQGADQGYWLPVDAALDDPSNWVSNGDITTMLKAIPARHVLVVADSCYSGTLTRAANVGTRDVDYILRMVQKKARTVMTSGGLEPVADAGSSGHSVFAAAFIAALQQNKGVMDAETFFDKVRGPVMLAATQTPQYSNLRFAGHEGGDFIFVRKQ